MKDYRKEEKIVQAYTSSENNEQIYEMTFNCAEVVELMQIAVKNLSLSGVSQQRELLIAFAKYMEEDKMYERHDEANVDDFLDNNSN